MIAFRLYLAESYCNYLVIEPFFSKVTPFAAIIGRTRARPLLTEEVSCPLQFQTGSTEGICQRGKEHRQPSVIPAWCRPLYLKDYGSQKPIKVSDSSGASAAACREENQCEKGEIMCSLTNGHPTRHRLIFHCMSSVRFE